MIKQWFAAAAMLGMVASAWAAVDVNAAGEDALVGIKGLGPAKAKAIVDERNAHGPFKNADDLASRVKGIGASTVERLQGEGLTVGTAGPGTAGPGTAGPGATGVGAAGPGKAGSGPGAAAAKPAASASAANARTAQK